MFVFDVLYELFLSPVAPDAVWALGPVATSLLISAGSSVAGKFASSMLGGNEDLPEVPDFSSEVRGQFETARRNLEEQTEENIDQVQADAAASGMNAIGATADVIDSNNEAMTELNARERDAVARAENQEKRLQFQQDTQETRRRRRNINQGIGSVVNAVSQAGTAYATGDLGLGDGKSSDGGSGGELSIGLTDELGEVVGPGEAGATGQNQLSLGLTDEVGNVTGPPVQNPLYGSLAIGGGGSSSVRNAVPWMME